jgi:two-component system cell cycle sensor histidine kinase/response regulator CckA
MVPPKRSLRLAWSALVVGAVALAAAGLVIRYAYQTSRDDLLHTMYEENLTLARALAGQADVSARSEGMNAAIERVTRTWHSTSPRYPGSFLCVIDHRGTIVAHTADSSLVGRSVQSVWSGPVGRGVPTTVKALIEGKRNWVGRNRSLTGVDQVVAYAYLPALDGLVAVHLPTRAVAGDVRAMVAPWALAFAFIVVVLIPLAIILLHRTYSTARRDLERTRAELEASEDRYRSLTHDVLEGSDVGTLVLDAGYRVVWMNEAVERILGWKRGEVLERDIREIVRSLGPHLLEDGNRTVERILAAYETGEATRSLELHVLPGPDREERWLEYWSQPVRSGTFAGGRVEYLADVTRLKQSERRIDASLSLLRATLESTTDGLLVVNLDGKIVSYNRRFLDIWSLPLELVESEGLDADALAYVRPQLKDPDAFERRVAELYRSPDAESYDLLEFLDGRMVERYSRPQKVDGRTVGRVWSFRDVTERRRLEESLRQSQKMEAVGRLAGGIAHDFNNLLTAINGYSSLVLRLLSETHPARGDVLEIRKAGERAAGLTEQLLAFSRRQVLRPEILDLNAVVEDMKNMLGRLIPENIALEAHLSPNVGTVRADRGQLEQVIMNLAVNARDAMPEGGRLILETDNAELGVRFAQLHPELVPGPYVMLAVSDTGAGMDEETRARVFEPFFTTKQVGKGTGLGLSTVYGIVRQSGGHVSVYSEVGGGTVFKIYLPREEATSTEAPEPRAAITEAPGAETILLAEDEDGVRTLIEKLLEEAGYRVLAAGTAEEALRLGQDHSGPIHLLLTDVVMPGMGGPELAGRLAEDRAGLRVLYTSGYTDAAVMDRGELPPGALFLQKPFTPAALTAKVREALGGVQAEA